MRFSKFHAQIENCCWLSLKIVRQKHHLKKLGKLKSEPALNLSSIKRGKRNSPTPRGRM
jgi:hypothetical protein